MVDAAASATNGWGPRGPSHPIPKPVIAQPGSWLAFLGQAAQALPFQKRSLHFGEELWPRGAPAPGLAVIAYGQVRLLTEVAGQEVHVVSLGPSDTLGAELLLGGDPGRVHYRASSACTELWVLDAEQARVHLAEPAVACALSALGMRRRTLLGLRRLPGLADASDEAILALASEGELLELVGSEPLAARAHEPGGFAALLSGELRERGASGERSLLPSDLLCALPMAGQAVHEAVRPSSVFRLSSEALQTLIARYPELSTGLLTRSGFEHAHSSTAADDEAHNDEDLAGELEPRPRRGRIRRMPWVRQLDVTDCGVACLAIVCRHFGSDISIHLLRRMLHAGRDGVHLRALCHAARQLGLAARSAKVSQRNLGDLPLPAIVHLDGNHWAVLYDVSRRGVRISDPAVGRVRSSRQEFERRWDGFVALFDYTEDFLHAPKARSNTAWLWPFVRPWSGLIGRALTLAGVAALVEGVLPVSTQVIIDTVLVDGDTPLLWMVAAALAGALVFLTIATLLQRYLLSFVAVRIDAGALDYLARKLLELPISYFEARRVGDLRRRLDGVRIVRELVIRNSVAVFMALARLLTALVLLGVYSQFLFALFLLSLPFYLVVMRISARLLGPLFDDLERGFGEYDSHQLDAIRGIETVKAMGAEGTLRQRMLEAFHKLAARQFRADFSLMAYDAGVGALSFLVLGTFLVVGAWQTLEGELTVGALVAVNALAGMASAPIGTLLRAWDDAQQARVLLDRIQDVLVEEPEQNGDRSQLIPVPRAFGEVRLSQLSFAFPAVDTKLVLQDLDLHIRPGMTVALVGRSGCGKSTLAKCLAGLYRPTKGRIFIDGVDLARMNLNDYRRQIGFVLQDTHLFDSTIAGNIALNDDSPAMDRVIRAAETARAAGFIDELPLGYETRVGNGGVGLSGGQSQRLSIARALYHDPPILILDEATSSLDMEAELELLNNLRSWRAGKTCIVVAHRLSTVRDADLTIVLEQGRIVETGTHRELLERRGLYHHLCGRSLEI